jgi:glycosyltransferase involved in cell wall biosynthesis
MIPPAEPFRQNLPDLAAYRREFLSAGVTLPLPTVPWRAEGLLAALPPPPAGRHGWPWDVQTAPFAENTDGWPSIAIVVPSFKQADYLEEALRSVLLQNYPRLEFIVMDGGSPDASPAILERYRPWLSFSRSAPDRGQSHAINLGFALADGELRGWLNSDDFYLPGTLRRVAETWRRSSADFIYGDQLVLQQETRTLELEPLKVAWDRYVKFPGLVASHAAFWKRIRHQPVWEEHHCAIDYELWIRLLPGTRKAHIPWPLGLVRHYAAAKTFDPAMAQKWVEDAERNGLAHPQLYRPRPWLDFEYRYFQALVRRWRARRGPRVFAAVCRECGWPADLRSPTP